MCVFLVGATTLDARLARSSPDEPTSVTATAPAVSWNVAIAPRLGLVVPTSKLGPTAIAGLQVDFPVAMDKRLLLGVDLSLTRPSHDGPVMDPRLPAPGRYTINETEMVIALIASYRFAARDQRFVPWVGAGPMAHLLRSSETTTIAPGDNTATSTALGFELAGGADLEAGPGYVVGDLRLAYSKLDHTITGDTNAAKVSLAVGYRFMF